MRQGWAAAAATGYFYYQKAQKTIKPKEEVQVIYNENSKRRQRWPPRFAFLGNYAVFFFFYVLFLTLLPQVILGFITYSREELLDIRATSTHHHYDQ